MKILVTAGATQTPIDKVRAITNIFKGKTGTLIAKRLSELGHEITLVTSNLELSEQIPWDYAVVFLKYKTFDELAEIMEQEIRSGSYDAVIHSAAVSDYRVTRVLIPGATSLIPIENAAKISGSHPLMYLEMVPTYKIVDKIREDWGFKGFLVKFKLQVGISDEELLAIARESRETSDADLIVANCLEWSKDYAYIVGKDGIPEKVSRGDIADGIAKRF
jgi:phosphopantothenate-cysteine ligase/phosphopantothenoylcysteine decarboxylase/phosphopantothenate--cysteine ligase